MTGSARMQVQRSTVVNEAIRDRVRPTATRATSEATSIQNNPLFKILMSEADPNAKKAEFEKFMTSTLDRDQDRARIKAYEEWREWLAHQNTALAQQIIELTNTKTFASLQKIIEDMNTGLIDFENDLKPLMDIVDAIYQLRTSGNFDQAYREIEEDRKADEQRKQKSEEIAAAIEAERARVQALREKNAELSQKRSFFGFGGTPESVRQEIARNDLAIEQARDKERALAQDRVTLLNERVEKESQLGEHAIHKEKLRELLDLSSEENVGRMQSLQQSALRFIDHSKESTATIRGEFGSLSSQLDSTEDNNRKMTAIYAIMTEGMRGAAGGNVNQRKQIEDTLSSLSEDDIIQRMQTEDKLRNLDGHSKMLHAAQGETLSTYAELSQNAIRVGSMKEATTQQVDVARKLGTQGVSATADRLASVMTAVSGAAIAESAGVVEHTLNLMRNKTNEITQQEVIRNAMYSDKIVNEMDLVMRELESFRDVQRVSSDITRQGIQAMNDNMSAMRALTDNLQKEIAESRALHSELAHTGEETTAVKPAAASTGFSFS
jgi:hypothetical protein